VSFVAAASIEETAGGVSLQGFLYAADGSRQLGREYRAGAGEHALLTRRFADDVVLTLTGQPGIADTRLAFVADQEGYPAIFSTTPDGADTRRLVGGRFECLFPRYAQGRPWLVYTAYPKDYPQLVMLDTSSGANLSISDRPGLNSLGAIHPDGTKVAATLSFQGNPEIYLLDLSGKVLQRLTNHRASDLSPAWSPDGTQLAFVSDRSGSPAIYLLDLAAPDRPRRLTHGFDSTRYAVEPSFSPRGDYLAFSGRGSGDMDVWVLRLRDGEFFRVTQGGPDEEAPEWAPDNRHLVVATRKGSTRGIEVLDVRVPGNRYSIPLPGRTGLRDPTWSLPARLTDSGRTP
jgi:TolB protein